jgi:hypothetical protein
MVRMFPTQFSGTTALRRACRRLPWTGQRLGNSVLFGHHVSAGTAVACTAHEAWIYYGEQSQFIAYNGEANSFRTYHVQLPDGSPTIWDCLVLPGLRREISTPALTIARRLWLSLYWLNVHDGIAEWIAVDAPSNFENGIRIFGSSGDDIVYARGTWQWPKELEFSAMPPNMPSKLLLNADHRHRQSHSQSSF